jgi:LmbE family N-acetylglucosaminyl deacetylase
MLIDMRWIYISPHLDDAILSCGGLIHEQTRQGTPVEIWTICAGTPPSGPLSPLAQACHFQWGTQTAEETVVLRKGEDDTAAAVVGAENRHFDIPDCIYRRSPQGDLLYTEDVFGSRHPFETGLDREIAAALNKQLRPDDILVCPLTIGGHLDHVLTRTALEGLERPLSYYADIPYVLNSPEELEPAVRNLHENLHPVTEQGLQAWMDGIAAYKSQILMLFETEGKMRDVIRGYWENGRGIRLWQPLGLESA